MSESEFENALARALDGNEQDLAELIERYGEFLRRVVRGRLDPRLRSKFDSVDFVQIVWMRLLSDSRTARRLKNAENLRKYLAGIARNLVRNENAAHFPRNSDFQAVEQRFEELDRELVCPPTDCPVETAIARERLELLKGAKTDQEAKIMRMRMRGFTYSEIGKRVGLHERKVRKIIERLVKASS